MYCLVKGGEVIRNKISKEKKDKLHFMYVYILYIIYIFTLERELLLTTHNLR